MVGNPETMPSPPGRVRSLCDRLPLREGVLCGQNTFPLSERKLPAGSGFVRVPLQHRGIVERGTKIMDQWCFNGVNKHVDLATQVWRSYWIALRRSGEDKRARVSALKISFALVYALAYVVIFYRAE
jgi:hypothetical protein